MSGLEYFLATYGLRESEVLFVPYGSRVYGTHKENSDYDYLAIIPENRRADTGTEFWHNNVNVHIYNRRDFQNQLDRHKIHCLEAYFLPGSDVPSQFKFELNLVKLRHVLAHKSSHSFVKAKKKIDVEHDYYIGWKSLFHSLRILDFGIQIAEQGSIVDYSSMNDVWVEIINNPEYTWDFYKEKYQPVYNDLASKFRKLAPKE